ncbi:MAG: hypothetical protein ABIV36_02050 [Sphingobium limneticum]
MRLIDDWRQRWLKFWSVRLTLIGNGLLTVLLAFPDIARETWASLPDDLKALLPVRVAYWIPVMIFVAATFARLVRQKGSDNG